MARLTFPKFDYTASLEGIPAADDPVVKRLIKIFKDAMVVRDRLTADYAKSMGLTLGGHEWIQPKDPKVLKAMKDAKKDVDDARDELRQALKERGFDIAAQHQSRMELMDKISAQTREAMRKAGLGETLERLEHRNAPMNMKHLIERCEAEVNEWESEGQSNANYEAEACKKHGGRDCPSCADGYHMNDAGKCVKAKGLGSLWKRATASQKTTLFPDELGNSLDRGMDAKGFGYNRDNRHSDAYRVGAKSYLHPNRTQK